MPQSESSMLIILNIFLGFFVTIQGFHEHCEDLTCESKEVLLQHIRHLQEQNEKYIFGTPAKESIAPSFFSRSNRLGSNSDTCECDACFQKPCYNGGTCKILDPNEPFGPYTCSCLPQFGGNQCQVNITCTDSSCGPNADCSVSNHQTNCVCKPGYSGNPAPGVGCQEKIKTACLSGDPHYQTFDSLNYDYMGTCPYIFSEPCTNLTLPFVTYSVKAKNEFFSNFSHVSAVGSTEVVMYGKTVHIVGKTKKVYVDGVETNVPYYYPSTNLRRISITYSAGVFRVQNDQLVAAVYDPNGKLCVEVPDIPVFNGEHTLCGLAGNIDGNYKDDIIARNGSVYPITSQHMPNDQTDQATYNEALDSWITQDFMRVLGDTVDVCVTGKILGNLTNCKNTQFGITECAPIQQAENGDGIFGACQGMGNSTIQTAYQNCVFDLCQDPTLKCPVLQMFARQCMNAIPNTDLGKWRDTTECPMSCPKNSYYSSCKSSCPATCANATETTFCDQGCSEGCTCLPGYVIDNTNLAKVTCIQVGDCGCLDPSGNMHPANQPWLSDNCQITSVCRNGTYNSKMNLCSKYADCETVNNQLACVCEPGFTGDGYNCTDINECLDPNSCNQAKGQGVCNNTIGSYWCTCNQFYQGHDCQYYLPRRHCADVYHYWKEQTTGVNWIQPPYPFAGHAANTNVSVFCDMDTDNGGWTLMSSDHGSGMANKTMSQYVAGFGTPKTKDVWLGLDIINGMTSSDRTSLRVDLIRCPRNGLPETSTYCTYPTFQVNDKSTNYTVFIPEICSGTEKQYFDGWARWDLSMPGPQFIAFDTDNSSKTCDECSKTFRNTGFWYDTSYICGSANLNGVRYNCSDVMDTSDEATYLYWSGSPLGQAYLYLRPALYPNYDSHPVTGTK